MTGLPVNFLLCACAILIPTSSAHGPLSMQRLRPRQNIGLGGRAILSAPIGMHVKPVGKNLWLAKKFNPLSGRWTSVIVNSAQLASLKKNVAIHNAKKLHWSRKMRTTPHIPVGTGGILGARSMSGRFQRMSQSPFVRQIPSRTHYTPKPYMKVYGKSNRRWNTITHMRRASVNRFVNRPGFIVPNFDRIDDTFDDRFDRGFDQDDFQIGLGGEQRWDGDDDDDDDDDRLDEIRDSQWGDRDDSLFRDFEDRDRDSRFGLDDNSDIEFDDLNLQNVMRDFQFNDEIDSTLDDRLLNSDFNMPDDLRRDMFSASVMATQVGRIATGSNAFGGMKDPVAKALGETIDSKPDLRTAPVGGEFGMVGRQRTVNPQELAPSSAFAGIGGDALLTGVPGQAAQTPIRGGIPVQQRNPEPPFDGMVFLSNSKSDRLMSIIRGASNSIVPMDGLSDRLIDVNLDMNPSITDDLSSDLPVPPQGFGRNIFALLGIDPQTMETRQQIVSQVPIRSPQVPDHPPPILLPNTGAISSGGTQKVAPVVRRVDDSSRITVSETANISPKVTAQSERLDAPFMTRNNVNNDNPTTRVFSDLAALALLEQMDSN